MKPLVTLVVKQEEIKKHLVDQLSDLAKIQVLPAASLPVAARKLFALPPDVLVVEASLGCPFSLDIVTMLKRSSPSTFIVLYSTCSCDEDAPLIEAGIHYYAAGVSIGALAEVVRVALRNRTVQRKIAGA